MSSKTTVITGAGIAVAGAGVLLIFMGVKNYTFETVLKAAIKGEPLVAGDTKGFLRNINPAPTDTLSTVTDTLSDEGSVTGVIREPGGVVRVARPLFDVDHFDWSGGGFG